MGGRRAASVYRCQMNHGHFDFARRAREALLAEKFQPDFPPAALTEANHAKTAPLPQGWMDLRSQWWSSIDNDDSRDLDQVEWAEAAADGRIRVRVGVADVAGIIAAGSACDRHARWNATSVYTGGPVFPMLPERFSTDLTSLSAGRDRAALVMEFVIDDKGGVEHADVFPALVRNHAQLAYDGVARWLVGKATNPGAELAPEELRRQLRLQAEGAARLQHFRREQGALALGGQDTVAVVTGDEVKRLAAEAPDAARDIIENFMIAANVAMAQFLRARGIPCLRRVVRTPKRWDRIQALAAAAGTRLPDAPDPRALSDFLGRQRSADPDRFPELSLAVLKSLGPGEYVVERPGTEHEGHFGLAVDDYTHSTAPNRRYADLVMQRLLLAGLRGEETPYGEAELTELAAHCTEREAAARHVERLMKKVAAALFLQSRMGEVFPAMITGASDKGVFARLLTVPAEGRVVRGEKGLDVGVKTRVKLLATDPQHGFIDLARE